MLPFCLYFPPFSSRYFNMSVIYFGSLDGKFTTFNYQYSSNNSCRRISVQSFLLKVIPSLKVCNVEILEVNDDENFVQGTSLPFLIFYYLVENQACQFLILGNSQQLRSFKSPKRI